MSDGKTCYDCTYARQQGGSCHLVCPNRMDFDPNLVDPCEDFKQKERDDVPNVNPFKVWMGSDHPEEWEEII